MGQLIIIVIAIVIGFALTGIAVKLFPDQFMRENFQHRRIPNACGLVFVVAGGIYFACLCSPIPTSSAESASVYLITLIAFGLLGFVDDVAGDRSAGGVARSLPCACARAARDDWGCEGYWRGCSRLLGGHTNTDSTCTLARARNSHCRDCERTQPC